MVRPELLKAETSVNYYEGDQLKTSLFFVDMPTFYQ